MPPISFEGAKNFFITGGNFGNVAGNVANYHFGRGFSPSSRTNAPSTYVDVVEVDSTPRVIHPERYLLVEHERSGSPPPNASMHSVPPSRAFSSPPISISQVNTTPLLRQQPQRRSRSSTSTRALPAALPLPSLSNSTLSSDNEQFYSASSQPLNLPKSTTEQPDVGSSQRRTFTRQQNDNNIMTPLTNSLGLNKRLTPSTELPTTLPPGYETVVREPAQLPTQLPPLEIPAEPEIIQIPQALSPRPISPSIDTFGHSWAQLRPDGHTINRSILYRTELPRGPRNSSGPRPNIPSRFEAIFSVFTDTVPLDTPLPTSRPPLHTSSIAPPHQQELDDPTIRFANPQVQRSSTKGYRSRLPSQSPVADSNFSSTPVHPPLSRAGTPIGSIPTQPHANSNQQVVSDLVDEIPTLSTVTELSSSVDTDNLQPHWTQGKIENWAGDVSGGAEDSGPSRKDRELRPTTSGAPHPVTQDRQFNYPMQAAPHQHTVPCSFSRYPDTSTAQRQSYNTYWGIPQLLSQYPHLGFNTGSYQLVAVPTNTLGFSGAPFGGTVFGGPSLMVDNRGGCDHAQVFTVPRMSAGFPY
ncbi:hypothetical protein AN958_01591 [Leucoagaricus sp. SymC.cos]|nr:hypothetical protein AN958_01591 [Leucoagaricus sp. SymC.cos]